MSEPISFAEYLNTHETLTYTNVGVSMLPLLRQGKDLFTVRRKGAERCEKGDVVLYRQTPNRYVLHRVIAVCPEEYVILGDNCIGKEIVRDADILGIMTGFVRNGKAHSVQDAGYRAYSWWILHTVRPRVFLKKCHRSVALLVKKHLAAK